MSRINLKPANSPADQLLAILATTPIGEMPSLPDFLRITPERNAAWRDWCAIHPAVPLQFVAARRAPSVDQKFLAEFEQENKLAAERRKAVREQRKLAKDATPTDLTGYRWSTTRSRWERDPFINDELLARMKAERAAKAGLMYNDGKVPAPDKPVKQSKPQNADDLGAQVSARYGTDRGRLVHFAKHNGCWDDKYDQLPNAGLVRMNVVNRLRTKVRKGHKVEWV